MEREIMKIKMESVNGLEMQVDKFEKILISHQQETEKWKKIKTEEAINYSQNQIVAHLEKDIVVEAYLEGIQGLEEEIRELKLHLWMDKETIKEIMQKNAKANQMVEELSRKLSACEDAKKMSDWIQEDMKLRELENVRYVEDLRRKNLEASRSLEELRRRMLAYEEEKKTASRVQEEMILRELENIRCVEDLRQQNLEANRKVEELRSRVLAFEEDKKMANLVLDEMKIRETENFRCLEDLRQKKSEADRKVEEFGDRVSALEEEKRSSVRVWEEMKVRETDSKRRLEGLERQKLEADKRMNEMEVRESDLRRQILEADDRVKEIKGRSLEACKAAEVNIKRFGNVLPIAEELCKLLKMNVDDLVSAKDKFVWGANEEGLISSSVVSGDSRNGATTTNGEAGPHASNKAVELTVSATEQPTKKQKTHNKTQTTPSSAAVIIDIIDCDDEEFFSSWSYEISPVTPKRKRSKRAVRVNKSLIKRKWMFGADMVRAFEEDDELCLHAICALYKQHVSTSQSTESSSKRFYHFESSRGVELAGCLIGDDPEHSNLTGPVDEIKQRYPDIVNQCRRLAIYYSSYFTAMPRTNEPLARSLTLVCCHRYVPPHTHVGACGTCCGVGEGEVMEL